MQDIVKIVLDLYRSILRFKWLVLLFVWVLSLLGWAFIYQIDDKYDASARIFVDSNRILQPLLKGIAVQPDVTEQVNLLSRTLLNRPNLEKLASMSDLDVEATTDLEKELLLNQLARDVRLSGTRGNASVYNVTYSHSDPKLAKRMVQSLITIFVESAIGDERKDTEVTQEFLDRQKEYYEDQLVEADARLAEFKRSNFGLLPDDRDKNEEKLDGYKTALLEVQQGLAVAESKLQVYRSKLRKQPRTRLRGGTSVSAVDSELEELRKELSPLTTRYTERYPRIQQIRERMSFLEEQRDQLSSSGAEENVNTTSISNPLFEELQTEYTLAEIEVGALRRQVADNTASVARLETDLDSMPDVAKELNRIVRGNESLLNSYHEILARRESARLSEQVEQNVDDVNFRVIDPPFVSSSPGGTGKEILSAGVFLVAVGAGLVSAFLLGQLVPVFYDVNTIETSTNRPVLGSVGKHVTRRLLIFNSISWTLLLLAAGLLVVVFAVIEAYYLGILSPDRMEAVMNSPIGPILEKFVSVISSIGEKSTSLVGQ